MKPEDSFLKTAGERAGEQERQALWGNIDVVGITEYEQNPEKFEGVFEAIRKNLEGEFPNSAERELNKSLDFYLTREFLAKNFPEVITELDQGVGYGNDDPRAEKYYFINRKVRRSKELYLVSSFLKGSALESGDPVGELREILKNRKILVLGDDTGSFSEVLQRYGVEAYGIEFDPLRVAVGHMGIVAEDGQPQTQLMRGNIKDIADPTSELFQTLQEKGPFDVIFSTGVFNSGSGVEAALNDRNFDPVRFHLNCDSLLKDSGFEMHCDIDMHENFSRSRLAPLPERYTQREEEDPITGLQKGTGYDHSLCVIPRYSKEKDEAFAQGSKKYYAWHDRNAPSVFLMGGVQSPLEWK